MLAASLLILMFRLFYDNYINHGELLDKTEFSFFFRGWRNIFLYWWLLAFWHYSIILLVMFAMKSSIATWAPLYVFHQCILLAIGIYATKTKDIGFACIFIILCEAVRMLMKSHSYFRTKLLYLKQNTHKNWQPKQKQDSEVQILPEIKITL